MEKRIMTYGSFDILRSEHIELFRQAKKLGDYLLVVLASDQVGDFQRSEEHRKIILEAVRFVDEVIIRKDEEQLKQVIKDFDIDLIVINKRWQETFDFLDERCEVIYL